MACRPAMYMRTLVQVNAKLAHHVEAKNLSTGWPGSENNTLKLGPKPGVVSTSHCLSEIAEVSAELEAVSTEVFEGVAEVTQGESVSFDDVVKASAEISMPVSTDPNEMPALPVKILDEPLEDMKLPSEATSEVPSESVVFAKEEAELKLESDFVDKLALEAMVGLDKNVMDGNRENVGWTQYLPDFIRNWLDGENGKRNSSLVLLNIMTFLFSTNYVVVKDAEEILDPYTFSAMRFIIGALAFAPFLNFKSNGDTNSGEKQPFRKDVAIAGIEIGVWSTLGYLTQTLGMKYTDASKAAFLGGLLVVMVPMFGGLMGKKISKVKWGGAALAVIGTSFLEQGSSTPFGYGDILCLMSAMFFGIQMIRTEAYSKALPADSALSILGIATATTAIISSGIAVYTHPGETLSLIYSLHNHTTYAPVSFAHVPWPVVLYTGALTTALVLFIEMSALQHVTATDAAIVYTIQPVLSGLMAFTFLGERFTSSGWVGAAIIVCGSLGAQLLGSEESEAAEASDGS